MVLLQKLNPFRDEEADEKDAEGLPPMGAAPSSGSVTGPECAVCNKPGADKKFGGQYFHRRCLRKMRKQAKGMI